MRFSALPLLALAGLAAAQNKATINLPKSGTSIAPGEVFDFQYNTMADYGVTSYNYTVWLFTSGLPSSFAPSLNWADGHFFGRFSEPNYPGNTNPTNLPPATLTMPNFSKSPGGFGAGLAEANQNCAFVVMEEYATGAGSFGLRISLTSNTIIYNATSS
uniref:Uncharacterized protein n=1 Tax=Mycena chlorophos TaxID=658473 RepID=A0ABQ0M9X6_MYCCL|nr:predicted protein [Mycena chlorophos]